MMNKFNKLSNSEEFWTGAFMSVGLVFVVLAIKAIINHDPSDVILCIFVGTYELISAYYHFKTWEKMENEKN